MTSGKWITTEDFTGLAINPVFHRELDKEAAQQIHNDIQNKHILFRQTFDWKITEPTYIRISADDFYKLYINGQFVGSGPAAGYPCHYFYNEINITSFLRPGKNVIAVHTYYQGLVNRVWVSGDNRHGLWLEIHAACEILLASDEQFKAAYHTAYSAAGIAGYDTQFLERYNASAPECGFEKPEFDDRNWKYAVVNQADDHVLFPQKSKQLVYEKIQPYVTRRQGNHLFIDFGAMYVGNLSFAARGTRGNELRMRFGQELNEDGSVRYTLRADCCYEEFFVLSGNAWAQLVQYDYKSFRYVDIVIPDNAEIALDSIILNAQHYPFQLMAEFKGINEKERKIWNLCVRSFHYGMQSVIQDCMDREKGYYLGDGCYSILTYSLLTHDYQLMEKFFDDFLQTKFINPGLMACASCSLMQEIAEYPLMMIILLAEYLQLTGNVDFVQERYEAFADILDYYREEYAEEDGLLNNLDKWCVVDWPAEKQDGYDVDVVSGKVCTTKHNVINAYYIGAIKCFNQVSKTLGKKVYADTIPLEKAFIRAFYLPEKHLFRDSVNSCHISLPGNVFAWLFQILPDEETRGNILDLVRQKRVNHSLFFVIFPMFCALLRDGETELFHDLMTDDNAWLNMLKEDATTTFEAFSKDGKWNTSLFHLTLAYAAAFLTGNPFYTVFT